MTVNLNNFAAALRSRDRLAILQLIGSEELSAIEVHRKYSSKNPSTGKHRESIYRDLEMLVEVGLLEKKYDVKRKQITYSLKTKTVEIELPSGKITVK